MSADAKITAGLKQSALNELRTIVPAGSYVLFTPYDSMIVSPDPEEIKRCLDTLTSHQ